MKKSLVPMITVASILTAFALLLGAEDNDTDQVDKDLAADLELLQGKWELLHGNEGKGPPTIRSVKTIEGNKETLRRYRIKDGKMLREHSVEFTLSKSGSVRVFTFFSVGGTPEKGLSFVYKVDQKNFWDIPGLLQNDKYRNYHAKPELWHWKRITSDDASKDAGKKM